jgi:hypothetical protein
MELLSSGHRGWGTRSDLGMLGDGMGVPCKTTGTVDGLFEVRRMSRRGTMGRWGGSSFVIPTTGVVVSLDGRVARLGSQRSRR